MKNTDSLVSLADYFQSEFAEHITVAHATSHSLFVPFQTLLESCVSSIRSGKKILFFGNGGSAADAQHLATELTVRFKKNRPAIPAIALTTDTSTLTAIGNDLGFEMLFARQIEALGQPGDVALGISTSGRSKNVILALKVAREKGLKTVAFTGQYEEDLKEYVDIILAVPSQTTSRIQEMHITLGQMLCGALETSLGLV
jgi:D-sedoheptulose 7-phosphate isomerase